MQDDRVLTKRKKQYNLLHTSCGFQSYLQAQSSLAGAVTGGNKVANNSLTLQALAVEAI
jgi:hypothetical protein